MRDEMTTRNGYAGKQSKHPRSQSYVGGGYTHNIQKGPNNNPCTVLDLDAFPMESVAAYTTQAVHLSQQVNDSNRESLLLKNSYEIHPNPRAAETDWDWVKTCHRCSSTHLDHAATYHLYYTRVAEYDAWVKEVMGGLPRSFDESRLRGDTTDVHDMIAEMKEVLLDYTKWQDNVEDMYDVSRNVHPLQLRHEPLPHPVDALMLCDFSDGKISLSEGEKVSLVDNSGALWVVLTENGEEAEIPAITVEIPPPCPDATRIGDRMLMQLLALWRTSVKRCGHQLIAYLLLVFRDWDENETSHLQTLSDDLRQEIIGVTELAKELLGPQWKEDKEYQELEERLERLRMIMEDEGEGNGHKNDDQSIVVVQIQLLRKLLHKYKDFGDFWEAYKDDVEERKPSTLIVLPETWGELRYVTSAYYFKFYERDIEVDDEISKEVTLILSETPDQPLFDTSHVTLTTSEETSEADQIITSVEEDQTTFVIEIVIDPRNNQPLTLEEAVDAGIFDEERGIYCNPDTGAQLSIAQALNAGKMCVKFKEAKKIREEKSTIGLITVKTTKETRPYDITHIVDPNSDEHIPLQEAIDAGFYDEYTGEYITEKGDRLSCVDAIDSGCVIVEYNSSDNDENGRNTKEETVKTYAVHAVVDQETKTKVSFAEAVNMGIVDRDTGDYYHALKKQHIHVSEAIKRGFVKARVVEDDKGLNIDPENTIVVERIKKIKSKLLGSMKVARALGALKGSSS